MDKMTDSRAAEAQGGGAITCPECHGTGGHYWHEADGSERGERCATCYGFGYYTAPPSAPVGVEGVRRYLAARDAKPMLGMDPDVIHAIHTGTEWEAALRVSDLCALAQQPAAVDGAMSPQVAKAWLLELMGDHDFTIPTEAFDELVCALAAQPGGSDNDR